MKKYIKLFLLLFTFTAVYTSGMAVELVDNTSMEIEVKTKSVDSEEKSKDFKVDLFITSRILYVSLTTTKTALLAYEMQSDTYPQSPFKPPRA